MLLDRPKQTIEETKNFVVVEHSPDLYELIHSTGPSRIGVFFSQSDASKFRAMLDAALSPSRNHDRELRKIYDLAVRNIHAGRNKL